MIGVAIIAVAMIVSLVAMVIYGICEHDFAFYVCSAICGILILAFVWFVMFVYFRG